MAHASPCTPVVNWFMLRANLIPIGHKKNPKVASLGSGVNKHQDI
jgi:hypothetical protein